MMYLNVTYTQKDQMTKRNDQKWTPISFGSDTLLTDDLSQFEPPSDGPAFNAEKKDLTPIWGILGIELASFLDKKSRVTFSVLMTSYLTENFLFHNNLKLH